MGEASGHRSRDWVVSHVSWCPQRDSNPRYRLERPVSWADLDDGGRGRKHCIIRETGGSTNHGRSESR